MKKYLLAAFVCLLLHVSSELFSQNVSYDIEVTGVERTNYGDCFGCGAPDPTWKVTVNDNVDFSYSLACIPIQANALTSTGVSYNLRNRVNTAATTFNFRLEAWEDNCNNDACNYNPYNFFVCFPSVFGDANHCQTNNAKTVNFKTQTPCVWHTDTSDWCGSYRFIFRYRWNFFGAPAVASNPLPADTVLCPGAQVTYSVASNVSGGWSVAQGFQWQVSMQTDCNSANQWSDIFGATSDSYTPPYVAGTRLYRCVLSAACGNVNTDYTYSNCARLTYQPYGITGDPAPSIQSGICGSTVLPGSIHPLNTLQPPLPGAIANVTGYLWANTGGTLNASTGSNVVWAAPVAPGSYSITVTYQDNCPQPDAISICNVTVGSVNCDFAYVSTSGLDVISAGGPDNPYRSLTYALTQLNGRTHIRVAEGTYTEGIIELQDNIVIEGAFRVTGNIWSKRSDAVTTFLLNGFHDFNFTGDQNIEHRVGFYGLDDDSWTLQDLTIQTTDVSGVTNTNRGRSNYAILLHNACENYNIVRCRVISGAATNGIDGTVAGAGNGGLGGNVGGAGGNGDGGCGNPTGGTGGAAGNIGGASPAGPGGSAGAGNSGCDPCGGAGICCGECDNLPQCSNNGANGGVGAGWSASNRPATPTFTGMYFSPAPQAEIGSGGGGGGQGGGGGGARNGTCVCFNCGGNPFGGVGGNGGRGGHGGTGGFGGGSSFALFRSNSSVGATITSVLFTAGAAGIGGTGGLGGNGLSGDIGFDGATSGCGPCSGATGQKGANGGAGGAGGRGRDGANGVSAAMSTDGTVSDPSTTIPIAPTLTIEYDNAKACVNSEIKLTKSGGLWVLPTGMEFINDLRDQPAGSPISSYNSGSATVLVSTSSVATSYDLGISGSTYADFLRTSIDARALPTLSPSTHTICIDGTLTLAASGWGNQAEYEWKIYQGTNLNSPVFQSTLPNPTALMLGVPSGLYTIRYKVREICCGWSKPVYDTLRILPLPTQFAISGGGNYCPGSLGTFITLNGSENGVMYELLLNGAPVDTILGNGAPLQFTNVTGLGVYTIRATRFSGCGQFMIGSAVVAINPQPLAFDVRGGGEVCASGSAGKEIYLTGSELGATYQLFLNGNIPAGLAIPGTGNPITFGLQTQPGIYSAIGTFNGTGCQGSMNDSAVISIRPNPTVFDIIGGGAYCVGDSGVQIGLNNSQNGFFYQLYQFGVLPVSDTVIGNGSSVLFGNFLQPGNYTVKVVDSVGCESIMNGVAHVLPLALPSFVGVVANNVNCFGANDGVINIQAISSNGNVTYSIDSGTIYTSSGNFTSLTSDLYYVAIKDDSGCVQRYAANPVNISTPLALTLDISGSAPDCFGNTNGNASVIANGGTPPYNYLWNTTPAQVTSAIGGLSGNFNYSVVVADRNNCTASDSLYLLEPTLVTVSLVPSNVTCFQGNDGVVQVSVSGGISPYQYFLNGIYQTDSIYSGLTANHYVVTAEDANHCTGAADFTITEPQQFSVNAGPDLVSVQYQTITLTGSASSANGIIGYYWQPDYHLSCTTCQNAQASPDTTTMYVLMAMDGDSCIAFDSMYVVVKPAGQAFIPSAFTPNADELNDYFEFNILGADKIEVTVFNRWGEKVYYNANQHNGIVNNSDAWDGKKNGKLLPHDTYVYQINVVFFGGFTDTYKGTVTLMK